MVSDIFGVFPYGLLALLMYDLGYDSFIPRFKVDTMVLSTLNSFSLLLIFLAWESWKRTKRVRGPDMDS